jgi:DNA-binding transcriptional ArsR family regulator
VDTLQVIAEPRRREILRLVWDEELSAGAIAARFEISFAAVSQHLGVLRDSRLVSLRRDGRYRYYRADRSALGHLRPALELLWGRQLEELARLAEKEEGRPND